MSFFDQRYYATNKGLMSRIGIWPEQSSFVRSIWPLTIFAVLLSFVILQMKLMLMKIEGHWKIFKNTSAVIVLHKYAEHGRFLTAAYSMYIYASLVLVLFVPLVPRILDVVQPLNQSRPTEPMYQAEYGVNPDEYFWPILAHSYVIATLAISIFIAIDTMYVMWVEHACALFEIVGFTLQMTNAEYRTNRENGIAIHDDDNYRKISECITVHKEAISFAGMIESVYSGSLIVVVGVSTIIMSITGLQAMINMKNPKVLLGVLSFVVGQAFHLWFNNLPGQKLIDHSSRVHNFAYDFEWYDMPVRTQKLLILILLRSQTPCFLTAGKVYVLSMENYASVMETAISYFLIFLQLY